MEKNKDNNRIHILAVDVNFSCGADFHTDRVNGKLNEIQNAGGVVIAMETHPMVFAGEAKFRTIITYKI